MKKRIFSMLAGSLVALVLISMKAHAEDANANWGDLGYSNPKAETEVLPMSSNGRAEEGMDNDAIASTISSAELAEQDAHKSETQGSGEVQEVKITRAPEEKNITDISSVQNTYGVQTEERHEISFYVAPFAGVSSMLGNDTVDSSPKYAAGATVGALLLHNLMVQASFVHSETDLSNPVLSTNGLGLASSGVFSLKQNIFSGGAKFYILGRESRVRPFVGGGVSYSSGSLNYGSGYAAILRNQSQYLSDLSLKAYQGYGELGAEVAITRSIVATIAFQVSGILSSDLDNSAGAYDATRVNVASSVGRTASYLASAGVGFYF